MFAEFHFLRPEWLLGLIPLVALLWLVRRQKAEHNAWNKVCDAHLLRYLTVSGSGVGTRVPLILPAGAWVVAVVALAGPVWEKQPRPVLQSQEARVIVLDLSQSMLAADLTPSRLMRARFKVEDILERGEEGQTALVVFAGDASVVSPLTEDVETIRGQLSALEPGIMPVQGSRADLGLRTAGELLEQAGIHRGDILLLADDSGGERASAVARDLAGAGHRTSVLAIGTQLGAPVPDRRGGMVRNATDEIVTAKLDIDGLREVAAAGGGRFATLTTSVKDLDLVLANSADDFGPEVRETDREYLGESVDPSRPAGSRSTRER